MWEIIFLDDRVAEEFRALPPKISANMTHIFKLLRLYGNQVVESHRLFMPINPQNTVAVSIKIIPFLLFVICDNCNYSEYLFHSRFSLVNLLI